MLTNPWLGIALLVSVLLGMLLSLRLARVHFALHPEVTRKLAHIGLGLATLSFPVLFDRTWPVMLLAAATVAVLAALRWVPPVRARYAAVVDGVARRTGGGFYFPVAAALLFVLAREEPILFVVPVLTLTFADAVAALVGVYYGRHLFATGEAPKSLEGSIACFTTAFLTTHIPLLLFTDTGRVESVLIGLVFGVLVMLLEAVSLRGTDNLLIPLGGFLLLAALLRKGAAELIATLLVTVLLLGLVLVLRRQRTLSDSAVLAAVLVGFVGWSVGGWQWLVPPLVLFLSYTLLWPRARLVRQRPHDLRAVAAVVAGGLLWLMLGFVLEWPELYYPYTLAFAAHLCFIGVGWYRVARPHLHPAAMVARSAAVAWLALFLPYVAIADHGALVLLHAGSALLWLLLGGLAFAALVPPLQRGAAASEPYPWMRQSLIGLGASALGLTLVLFGLRAP